MTVMKDDHKNMSKEVCEKGLNKDTFENQNEENFESGSDEENTDDKTVKSAGNLAHEIKRDFDESSNEDEFSDNVGDLEIDEPVSPPPCDPEDAPELLISQNIEDLATEVVVESRKKMMEPSKIIQASKVYTKICTNKNNPSLNDIPKTVLRPTVSVSGPSLIPLTVSEMEADEEPSSPVSSSLHMSGGGVYTTDSFYYLSPIKEKQRCSVITKVPERKSCNKYENNSEQKIDDLVDFFSKNSSESSSRESVVCRIPQPTIKISDSLEITPITIKPIPFSKVGIMKRKLQTTSTIPEKRKCLNSEFPSNSKKHDSESDTISSTNYKNDIILYCKLVINNDDSKKVKLVFDNGVSVQLSKQILKKSNLENHQTNKIRRKQMKKVPKSSEKSHEHT